MEVWIDCSYYNGVYVDKYQTSDTGLVRSLDRLDSIGRKVTGKILAQEVSNCGYLRTGLSTGGKAVKHLTHRLVAWNHVEGYFDGATVDHIDGDKTNNTAKNLRWVTHQQNKEYSSSKHYLIIYPCGKGELIYNLRKFCREHSLDQGNMVNVSRGLASHCKGFKCRLLGAIK